MAEMINVDLDFAKVKALLRSIVTKADAELGQGRSSEVFVEHAAGQALEFLWENTHQFAPLLFMSYKMQGDKTTVRGFFDPKGLVREIVVDPAIQASIGEPPVEYAPIEFSRPGVKDGTSHDTFGAAELHFESWVDEGFDKFSVEFGKQLGF